MTAIPANLARVPNLLSSQLIQRGLGRTGVDLLNLQGQLSSGKRINRPSDDPIAAALASAIEARLAGSDQRLRNLSHGSSTLATVDQTLGEINELALQAKTVIADQIGAGSDADTRRSQAVIVESLIQELFNLSNRQYADLYVLGGERVGAAPMQHFFEGFRYAGFGDGLLTELGQGLNTPITIGADRALGALSARIEGEVDLNPALTVQTPLSAVRGADGAGVRLGSIEIEIDDGVTPVTISVDLTQAQTIGDIANAIESAIRETDPAALTGAYPTGVGIHASGQRLSFNIDTGYTIQLRDLGGGTTAADLGLSGFTYDDTSAHNPAIDLDPALTPFTTFGQLGPTPAFAPGDIVIRNGGRQGVVTITPTTTIAELQREVQRLGLGVRLDIAPDGRRLNLINEISGLALSVEESGGGTFTAASIGLRSLSTLTSTSVFNHGRGVEIAHGVIHPVTGLPDPTRNVDFEVTLSDGTTFTVDLEPDDLATVGSVLARINAAAAGQGVTIGGGAGEFEARLIDGGNGIALVDNLGGPGAVTVRSLNGHAAEDLGLLSGTVSAGPPAILAGEDRATVRIDGLFSTLIDLKRALETNDERGIAFAGERIEDDLERLTSARAVVGGRAQRIEAAKSREEDGQLLDRTIKGGLEDLDFVEATSRFSLLQLLQQAGYQSAGLTQSLTLLNFLR